MTSNELGQVEVIPWSRDQWRLPGAT